jgi:hypothetical protein
MMAITTNNSISVKPDRFRNARTMTGSTRKCDELRRGLAEA